jgi:hypothetical protein
MVRADEASNPLLFIAFSVAGLLLFSFIAWKPQVWAWLTPIKPCSIERLAKIYRWIAIISLAGILINFLVAKS